MSLRISRIELHGDTTVVRLSGVDAEHFVKFESQIQQLYDAGVRKFVLDLCELRHLNSMDIGAVIEISAQLRSKGGVLVLANSDVRILTVLTVIKLAETLDFYPSVKAAIAAAGRLGSERNDSTSPSPIEQPRWMTLGADPESPGASVDLMAAPRQSQKSTRMSIDRVRFGFAFPDMPGLLKRTMGRVRRDRVMFGASVPNACTAHAPLVVRFIAYQKSQAARAKAQLQAIAPVQRQGLGLGESRVARGARLDVIVFSPGAIENPPPQSLFWDCRIQSLDFRLVFGEGSELARTVYYRVVLNGVIVAAFSMDIVVATTDQPPESRREAVGIPLPRHVFASYSNEDRLRVLDAVHAVMTLTDIDVFLDCLSLRNGIDWESQLRAKIKQSEKLWLFWSHHARDSKWVRLEWRTAVDCHGLGAIVPQALESLALAPPPPELASLHFSDTIAQIRESVERSR